MRIFEKEVRCLVNDDLNIHKLYLAGDHKIIADMCPAAESIKDLSLSAQLEVAWSHHLAKTKEFVLIVKVTDHVLSKSEDEEEIKSALKLQPLAMIAMGHIENACAINGIALQYYPNDGEQWNTQANLFIKLEEYPEGMMSAGKGIILANAAYEEDGDPIFLRHLGHALRALGICLKEIVSPQAAAKTLDEAQNSYVMSESGDWKATTHIEGLDRLRATWGLPTRL